MMKQLIPCLKTIALITSLSLLNGCTSISREDCMRGSWYDLGLKDGRSGTSNKLANYQKDCAEYGVQVNSADYQAGRTQGLENYCQLNNAIETGLRGDRYQHGICPATIDARFDEYNNTAYQVYKLKDDIHSLDNSIESKKYDISRNNGQLNNNNYTEVQKKQDELNKDLNTLQTQRSKAIDDLNQAERKISEYRNQIGY